MIRGTREWAVAEINCAVGCPYGCRYCYARTKALKTGRIADPEQWRQTRIPAGSGRRSFPRYCGQVMFPAAHDLVTDNFEICLATLDALLAVGNRVLVVSKPSRECIAVLCERYRRFRRQLRFRFTITARDPELLRFWEPFAPDFEERLQALRTAAAAGYATSVSVEPMLDSEDVAGLVEELAPRVSHSIWIGTMNRIAERVRVDSELTRQAVARIEQGQSDSAIQALYRQLRKHPLVRWKDSIKQVVGLEPVAVVGEDR